MSAAREKLTFAALELALAPVTLAGYVYAAARFLEQHGLRLARHAHYGAERSGQQPFGGLALAEVPAA